MDFNQVQWFPLCAGLTVAGLIASWFVWRRRGVTAALRTVAWSLLPLAAYLLGLVEVLWKVGVAIAGWALAFVFSPAVWLGVIVTGLAVVLFLATGVMRRHKRSRRGPSEVEQASGDKRGLDPAGPRAGADDPDDFSEIEAILRKRDI